MATPQKNIFRRFYYSHLYSAEIWVRHTVLCRLGKHLKGRRWPDYLHPNFCAACGALLRAEAMQLYRVTLQSGEHVDVVSTGKREATMQVVFGGQRGRYDSEHNPLPPYAVHPSVVRSVQHLGPTVFHL